MEGKCHIFLSNEGLVNGLVPQLEVLWMTGEVWKGGLEGHTSPYPLFRWVPSPRSPDVCPDSEMKTISLQIQLTFWHHRQVGIYSLLFWWRLWSWDSKIAPFTQRTILGLTSDWTKLLSSVPWFLGIEFLEFIEVDLEIFLYQECSQPGVLKTLNSKFSL